MKLKEIFAVHPENHTTPINAPCGQNLELLMLKSSGLQRGIGRFKVIGTTGHYQFIATNIL
jgi:hypothetical protein